MQKVLLDQGLCSPKQCQPRLYDPLVPVSQELVSAGRTLRTLYETSSTVSAGPSRASCSGSVPAKRQCCYV